MNASRRTTQVVAPIAVALSGGLWGAFWLPMRKVEAAGLSGGWATIAFFVPIIIVLAPFAIANWRAIIRNLRTLLPAGALTGAAFSLYATGLILSDVVQVILLFYLTPVWGTLLSRFVMGEPITRARAASLAAGLLGLMVILDADQGMPLPRNMGDWMALLAGITWAAGTLFAYQGKDTRTVDLVFMFCLAGAGLGVLLLFLPVEGNSATPTLAVLEGAALWIGVVAFAFTLPTMFITLWAAKLLDPGRVGLLLMSEVLVGVLTAALWSGEPFGAREATGAVLIVTAGLIEVLSRR